MNVRNRKWQVLQIKLGAFWSASCQNFHRKLYLTFRQKRNRLPKDLFIKTFKVDFYVSPLSPKLERGGGGRQTIQSKPLVCDPPLITGHIQRELTTQLKIKLFLTLCKQIAALKYKLFVLGCRSVIECLKWKKRCLKVFFFNDGEGFFMVPVI